MSYWLFFFNISIVKYCQYQPQHIYGIKHTKTSGSVNKMINSTRDREIEEIRRRKIEEMLNRVIQPLHNKPVTLTESNFTAEIKKNRLMLVDFWAPWCGPCKTIAPIIEQLASKYSGKVVFGKVNVDNNQRIAQRYSVQGIPTLLIFKDGQPIDRLVGAAPKTYIESKIESHIY
jgi:thioredoxin 1